MSTICPKVQSKIHQMPSMPPESLFTIVPISGACGLHGTIAPYRIRNFIRPPNFQTFQFLIQRSSRFDGGIHRQTLLVVFVQFNGLFQMNPDGDQDNRVGAGSSDMNVSTGRGPTWGENKGEKWGNNGGIMGEKWGEKWGKKWGKKWGNNGWEKRNIKNGEIISDMHHTQSNKRTHSKSTHSKAHFQQAHIRPPFFNTHLPAIPHHSHHLPKRHF